MSEEGLTDSPDFLDQAVSELLPTSEAVEGDTSGATESTQDRPVETEATAPVEDVAEETATEVVEEDPNATEEPQEDQDPQEGEEDLFTNRDPETLPPELKAQYLSMQRDYTQKTQLVAPVVKAVKHNTDTLAQLFDGAEGANPEDLAAAAVEHFAGMYSDPEVAKMHFDNLAELYGFGNESAAQADSYEAADGEEASNPEAAALKEEIKALEERLNERDSLEQQLAEQQQQEALIQQQTQELVGLYEATKEDPRFKHFSDDEWQLIGAAGLGGDEVDFLGTAEAYERLVDARVKALLESKESQPNVAAGGVGGPAVEPSDSPKSVDEAGQLAEEFLKQNLLGS
jgi:hypothetical protein